MRSDKQQNFFDLEEKLGKEGARKLVAQRLREAADLIEKEGWPDIYGCDIPENGICKDNFIDRIEVVLSYPWPG